MLPSRCRGRILLPIRSSYPDLPADTTTGDIVGVAAGWWFARNSGKLCFARPFRRVTAPSCRAMISLAGVGDEALDAWSPRSISATSCSSAVR